MRVVSVIRTTMPVNFAAPKPALETFTVYVPTGSRFAVNDPAVSVFSDRTGKPVSWLTIWMSALATSAPEGSCTTPVIAPVAPPCAAATPSKHSASKPRRITFRKMLVMQSSLETQAAECGAGVEAFQRTVSGSPGFANGKNYVCGRERQLQALSHVQQGK